MDELKETVLITGGTSGIGLAVAQVLAKDGIGTVLLGRDRKKGKETESNVPGSRFIVCDVCDTAQCNDAVERASKGVSLTGVVTSAGIYGEGLLADMTDEEMDRFFQVNVYGTMRILRAAIPHICRNKGAVVTVASDAVLQGNVQCSLYGATKGAVAALTRSLALELAVYGIRVNCVCPGDVETPLLDRQLETYGGTREELAGRYPLMRLGRAEEIGELIAFLLSQRASFITGAVIPADGGLTDW